MFRRIDMINYVRYVPMWFIKHALIHLMLFVFIAPSLNAQDKHTRVDLKPYEEVVETLHFTSGFVLKTDRPRVVGKQPKKLIRYNQSGEQVWSIEIKPLYDKLDIDKLMATPNGEYIYTLEMGTLSGFGKYEPQITQIDLKGTVRKFKSDKPQQLGKSLLSIFCDDQYLYYLTSQNGDERHPKKKAEEKLLLTRFSHTDFSSKTITLNVPAVLADENTSFWFYMGSVREEHYLASKTTYPDFGKNDFQVVTFNAEGEIKRTMKFGITLKNKFTRMSYVYWPQSASFEDIVNYDRTFASVTSTTPGAGPGGAGGMTSTTTRNNLTDVAFANLLLDEKTKSFYAFGLLGPKPFKNVASEYEGFYIHKFDLNGNPVWQLQESERTELTDDKFFRVHALPYDRDIAFRPGEDKHELVIGLKSTNVTYTIDDAGVLTGKPKIHEDVPGISPFRTVRVGKSYAFMEKKAKEKLEKQVSFEQFLFPESEIVVIPSFKKAGFDLYYFKK
ncbi:MAG: hypothetical protein QY309_10105 [Cyclobacteriaceae bacterium]|nr:MAG: hypothetical protein QY309_10105 [Cyclobacteriaceae bacterium]